MKGPCHWYVANWQYVTFLSNGAGLEIEIHPLAGALGADVTGVTLSGASNDECAVLRTALDQHQVIRVRGQELDRFQLSALGAKFGPHFHHPIVSNGFDDCPEVLELRRDEDDQALFGGESWHADISWMKPVGYVSILHALEIPSCGGDTCFASTTAAFETLSPAYQELLRGLKAVHAYHWYERREEPPHVALHPVVRAHPVTGREGLYVNRMFTSRFVDMTVEESAPLLDYLFAHMERHEFTCRFRWQVGDVLMWDNRFCLHYPLNDFSGQRRRMIRTSTLEGTLEAAE